MAINAMRIRVSMPKYTDAEVLMEFSIMLSNPTTIKSGYQPLDRQVAGFMHLFCLNCIGLLSLALSVAAFSVVP
jgi:hypothetical protein